MNSHDGKAINRLIARYVDSHEGKAINWLITVDLLRQILGFKSPLLGIFVELSQRSTWIISPKPYATLATWKYVDFQTKEIMKNF